MCKHKKMGAVAEIFVLYNYIILFMWRLRRIYSVIIRGTTLIVPNS